MSDAQQLIRQAQQGDPVAFEALVQTHAQFVYNLALRLLKNSQEAEDLAQETFIRVWQALPRYRADSQFTTWLYRIVTNLCYNRLPTLKGDLAALNSDEAIELADDRLSAEAQIMADETERLLQQAITNLPATYQLLITLRHLQELSYEEIATVTQMPLGTVKTGLHRARKLLKEALHEHR